MGKGSPVFSRHLREIAAHLHGQAQGKLLLLKGRLQQLLEKGNHLPETSLTLKEITKELGQVAQEELSDLSRRLYPSLLRRGLVPALRSLGNQFQGAFAVELELSDELTRRERADRNLIPESVRLAAYRIGEEALNNAVKHAQAQRVTLCLDWPETGGVRLRVQDNGQGFAPGVDSQGLGMMAMQDYAGALGGSCAVESSPGQGVKVVATLPFALEPVVGLPGIGVPSG